MIPVEQQVLLLGLAISIPMGAIVNRTNFCAMGGVADWITLGKKGRLFAWFFASALAILLVSVLQFNQVITLGNTVPPYQSHHFAWSRYILGGFIFGIGMTLGGGCGNKVLVNIGGGSVKALVVAVFIGFAAYLMTKTDLYNILFQSWMAPLVVDLSSFGINSQSMPEIIRSGLGLSNDRLPLVTLAFGVLLALLALVKIAASPDFRANRNYWIGGSVVGLSVVSGWYITAGPLGVAALEAAEWMAQRPISMGSQSLTFVNPMAEYLVFLGSPTNFLLVSFGMACSLGVILGSFGFAVASGRFRLQRFTSFKDAIHHAFAGLLMGIGGVLAMGCTIGQGVTGVSTLALGSFLALASIISGSALTLKIQLYRMYYDGPSFSAAALSSLADMRLLPDKWRRLERP